MIRTFMAILATIAISVTLLHFLAKSYVDRGHQIVYSHAVISECGIIQVIVVRGDNSIEIYDAKHPVPPALEAEVMATKPEQRGAILVRCPYGDQPRGQQNKEPRAHNWRYDLI